MYERSIGEIWRKACAIYDRYLADHKRPIGRRKLAELLNISESLARELLFAIKYRRILLASHPEPKLIKARTVELILTDIHIPYHDETAIEAVYSYLSEEHITPDIIVLLGDVIDFYKVSKYIKNPTKKSVSQEIEETRAFLEDLRNLYPDARICYLYGNHEERLSKYICENAAEIYDLVENLLEDKLNVKELNIEVYTAPFRIGKLWHLHGHEKPGGSYSPEHIPNVIWKYVHDHFICGHFHRVQEKVFRRIDGHAYWGGVVGYLAQPMDYAKLNNWIHGFAIIRYDEQGNFRPNLKTIINGDIF